MIIYGLVEVHEYPKGGIGVTGKFSVSGCGKPEKRFDNLQDALAYGERRALERQWVDQKEYEYQSTARSSGIVPPGLASEALNDPTNDAQPLLRYPTTMSSVRGAP